MRGLIKLVNDNHVDNYLKDILAFVYYGSIVNNRSKNRKESGQPYAGDHNMLEFKQDLICIKWLQNPSTENNTRPRSYKTFFHAQLSMQFCVMKL